ncbi:MAG: Zn-dependent exopeptidase M28 [Deltaproteobacteria bacterium]|nr:Zn-dependent exopeptidase M28 [Deltaproteobacteria bacterium]MBN2671814.1 Zn-dependent exopeptidase M28 [Deltaproteobacteria bacterium]
MECQTSTIFKWTKHTGWLLLFMLLGSCNTTCSGAMSGDLKIQSNEPSVKDALPSNPNGLTPLAACIDGNRAMGHAKKLVSFAPRHAGTDGLKKTREYIASTLLELGMHPVRHPFTAYTPHPDMKTVDMENISVSFVGKTDKRVLLTGHFDGKIIDDGTFYGANDGGSSTGLLLEMARCLHVHPPEQSVTVVFFDGEEALVKWTDSDSLYGSKNYVSQLMERGEHKQIASLVNVDMIGDKRLRYVHDTNSTPWVFNALRETAVELGHGDYFSGPRGAIGDDHIPFLQVDIPAAVLIDLSFGPGYESNAYWHTENDDMSRICGASMEATGEIVLSALPRLMAAP